MAHMKIPALLLTAFCLFAFAGCAATSSSGSTAAGSVQKASISTAVPDSQSQALHTAESRNTDTALTGTIRVAEKADLYGTSKGRIALALIICKLDSSKSLSDLAQKDAATLFELLRETAMQKSVTLETVDKQYDVTDILASEGIYESIQANNVTSLTAGSSQASVSSSAVSDSKKASASNASSSASASSASLYAWIPEFETAINAK